MPAISPCARSTEPPSGSIGALTGAPKRGRIPRGVELDRVAIFGHPISKPKQGPSEDGPIKVEINNRSHQVINDRDEADRLRLRRDQVLEKLFELGVLDCFQGRRNKI